MEKLNELVKLAGKVLSPENAFEGLDAKFEWKAKASPTAILAIAEAFRVIEQRAEAAEAQLAELAKQEAIGMVVGKLGAGLRVSCYYVPDRVHLGDELFTRPAPAADLAELVPDDISGKSLSYIADKFQVDISQAQFILAGFNYHRAALLRNIEEAK